MDVTETRLSPLWGWAVAGAVSFPAVTFALGAYQTTGPLVVVATGIAGLGLVGGAALAARGRGSRVRESVWTWAVAYAAGVLVYVTGLGLSWPQADREVIVTPDGRGALNGTQEFLLLLFSIAVALLLGTVLDEAHRAVPGRTLKVAARAAAAWAVALLPLPLLIAYGLYGAAVLAQLIPVGGKVPAFLLGLICSGLLAGLVVSAIGESVMRRLRA